MDNFLSQLKPIVCLNSIKSIYKKQSDQNEQLTRKRILMRYLNKQIEERLGGQQVDKELKEVIV